MEHKNVWEKYDKKQLKEVDALSDAYRSFLDNGKTERECIDQIVNRIENEGYVEIEKLIKENKTLKAGDKVYTVCMDKMIALFHMGEEPISAGMNILGAHIDSPRIDIKQNPLYENSGLAYMDTHYYGGIKKYQWTNIPLSMHGTVVKTDGEKVNICIGEKDEDPIFTISDLLPHLAGEQMERKLKDGVQGEELNVLVGSIPYEAEDVSERVKLNILRFFVTFILHDDS